MSETARVKELIDLEIEASHRALYGLAVMASHEAITARMERMAEHLHVLDQAGKEEELKALLMCDKLWI
ncbi:hypothetical protein KDW_38660 [Dictyobacter vulcani]|uniref:Uncharacterized protein n=1 Tax=Dictyobacter vulcani TaxID=2607529 RepID=A0A5J4KJM9_9CHLR|nr:hypothetical protein [Dictyobacter vulcani]GER89704.1 hypothetical protein KDW_38660 [Dictyobacter vulcani]